MAAKQSKADKTISQVMRQFKAGELNTGKAGPGTGPKVKSRKQALAIALSEAERGSRGKARKR